MSGLQSLLKYRFQRKETEKLNPVSESAVNGNASSASTLSQNSVTSIPDTPPKSSESAYGSPVIQKSANAGVSAKRGALVIGSDSEPDQSPVKSSSSSPWLSKAAGGSSVTNGGASGSKNSKGPTFYYGESKTESPEKVPHDEERELMANIATLQDLFPMTERNQIISALAVCDNHIERATDHLIAIGRREDGAKRKRVYQRIQSDSSEDPSPSEPSKKKARPLEYSESQESTQGGSQMTTEQKLDILRHEFYTIQDSILTMTLKSKDNDLEKAKKALISSGLKPRDGSNLFDRFAVSSGKTTTTVLAGDSAPGAATSHIAAGEGSGEDEPPLLEPIQPIQRQANMGSIKAFMALNKQQSVTSRRESDDTDDVTAGKSPGSASKSLNRDERVEKRKAVIESDDEAASSSDSEAESNAEDEDPIVHLLNDSTLHELASINGCSKKKAHVIVKERPFNGWEDLVAKIEHSRELSFTLISACKEVLRMRGVVDKLMKSCKRISFDMENIVNDLTGNVSLDGVSTANVYIKEQPQILSSDLKLKPYQMIGLNWLKIMHDQSLNGILGDEMGLGKTVQTIAFIAHLLEQGEKGPHIIVAPSSTLDNWLRELKRWCPDISVIMYYGSQEERRNMRWQVVDKKKEYHVMVTTYNMASGSVEDRIMFKKIDFQYAIFDEGHMLKNMSSMRYQSLMKIKAAHRLVLTGTPLQNNLVELMSLLAFVMPHMFMGKTDHVKKIFTMISSRSTYDTKSGFERQTILNAKEILRPFFLRRLKRDVLQQLPQKNDIIEKLTMIPAQQELYSSLKTKFNKELRASQNVKAAAGSSMLMELRKASNHQLLHRRLFTDSIIRQMAKVIVQEPDHPNAVEEYVYEDMEVMNDFDLHKLCLKYKRLKKFALSEDEILSSGKFKYLDEHLPELKERGDRVLVFSQFTMVLDIIEEYMTSRGHRYLRLDGSTPVSERQDLIDTYNEDAGIFTFLLSTKAGGLGINLTAANVVIIHDIDFNPYNDKQAEDRCHRVGQTRDVTVYRLISKNTIEESMLRCAQAKLQLEQDVTGQGGDDGEQSTDVMSLLKDALNVTEDS